MAGAVVALMKISNNLLLDDNEDAETLSMSQRRTSKMLTFVYMRGPARIVLFTIYLDYESDEKNDEDLDNCDDDDDHLSNLVHSYH